MYLTKNFQAILTALTVTLIAYLSLVNPINKTFNYIFMGLMLIANVMIIQIFTSPKVTNKNYIKGGFQILCNVTSTIMLYCILINAHQNNFNLLIITSIILSYISLFTSVFDNSIVKLKDIFYIRKFKNVSSHSKKLIFQIFVFDVLLNLIAVYLLVHLHQKPILFSFLISLCLNLTGITIFYFISHKSEGFSNIKKLIYILVLSSIISSVLIAFLAQMKLNEQPVFIQGIFIVYIILVNAIPFEIALNLALKEDEKYEKNNTKILN